MCCLLLCVVCCGMLVVGCALCVACCLLVVVGSLPFADCCCVLALCVLLLDQC